MKAHGRATEQLHRRFTTPLNEHRHPSRVGSVADLLDGRLFPCFAHHHLLEDGEGVLVRQLPGQGIVSDAAADAGVTARVLRRLSAGVDHPTGLAFPEGEYLKGLLIRVA